jgi:glutathione synthase
MRIGFVVNDVQTEKAQYTTTRLAMSATRMGHEAWMMGVGDFAHRADGTVGARARSTSGKKFKSLETYLAKLQDDDAEEAPISVDDLDVLMLRNDPAEDVIDRPWAVASGILFAQLSVANGVLVVNDPASLANAINKTYFQHFPEVVRPRTLISRDPTEIVEFVHQVGDSAVLKPLQGSGGSSVFRVSSDESPNLNQMIEAISRDGYVVAQEFLTEAEQGDVRFFVMNGQPLRRGDVYAAFRRVSTGADFRSNMHVGAEPEPVHVTDDMLSVVEAVRPKLIEDGMFLVGLDIVGAKLMEINVFSPGGLGTCQTLYNENFAEAVIAALERKIALRPHYPTHLDNARLATL